MKRHDLQKTLSVISYSAYDQGDVSVARIYSSNVERWQMLSGILLTARMV